MQFQPLILITRGNWKKCEMWMAHAQHYFFIIVFQIVRFLYNMTVTPAHIASPSAEPVKDWVLLLGGNEAEAVTAFTHIFKRFEPLLTRYITPFVDDNLADAKEVVQLVFIRLWEKREKMVGVEYLDKYLYRMARNATWDYKEKLQQERQRQLALANTAAPAFDVADQLIELKELEAEAVKALSLLPERRRLIFLSHTLDDLSLDEIAAAMDISKDVVKKQLHLATRFLKDHIAKKTNKQPDILFLLFFF